MAQINAIADDLIQALGRSIGIDDLKLNPTGYCCLGFDSVIVNLERDQIRQEFLLYAEVSALSPDISSEDLLDMLQANHYGIMTGSGSIGIDRASARIYLSERMLFQGLDAERFGERIALFVERAEAWQRYLARGHYKQDTADDIPTREQFVFFRT